MWKANEIYNQVLFAGYTIPHPAEDQMHLRIQTAPDYLAQTALKWEQLAWCVFVLKLLEMYFCFFFRKALVDLRALTVLTKAKFEEAETKYAAENPEKWRETEKFGYFFNFQRPMALVDLDPDSWQSDYNSAERLHR